MNPPTSQPQPQAVPQQTLRVKIRTREKVIYDDLALAVSSYNYKGLFDILPQHINFISIITNKIIIHKVDNTLQEYPIKIGVLQVEHDVVTIFLGIVLQNEQQIASLTAPVKK